MSAQSPRDVGDIIRQHFQSGDYLPAFEAIYANAQQGGRIPWDDHAPNPLLTEWQTRERRDGAGQTALVIGCGLGDDAEFLAAAGYRVTAFDVSPTAIEMARQRFPQSPVTYQMADVFALPAEWAAAYDFVLECRTIQALPWQMSAAIMTAVAGCVKPDGELLVLCFARETGADRHGIPWPLSRDDLAFFATLGLREVTFETLTQGRMQFRVLYTRSG